MNSRFTSHRIHLAHQHQPTLTKRLLVRSDLRRPIHIVTKQLQCDGSSSLVPVFAFPPRMCFISIRSHGMHPESGRLHRELVMNSLSAKLEYYRDKTEGNAPKKNRILTSQQTHPRPKEKSSSLSRERHSSGKSTRFLFGSAHFCLSCWIIIKCRQSE